MFDLHSANYWPTSLLYVGNVSEWAEAADANTESNSWNSKFFVSRCKNKKKVQKFTLDECKWAQAHSQSTSRRVAFAVAKFHSPPFTREAANVWQRS